MSNCKNSVMRDVRYSSDDLYRILTRNTHGWGYYHLTKWSFLCKMMERVEVPDDKRKHRMLHLSAAINMNDADDKRCGKGVFFTSFSFGPKENISMWTNYGIPNEEAVRVKFKKVSIIDWVKDFRYGKIRVYGVTPDDSLEPLTAKMELILGDVAYWSKDVGDQNKTNNPDKGLFIHNFNSYRLKSYGEVKKFKEEYPYLVKEDGWSYEREARLILKFNEDLSDQYKRVAVPFDRPFEMIDNDFYKYVTRGPWFAPGKITDKASEHSLSEAMNSRYQGLVKMRSVCDSCPDQDKQTCQCKFKGQR